MSKKSKEKVNKIYADTVKELRVSQGMMAQDDLAEAIGLWSRKKSPKATIGQIERGETPSGNMHAAILAVLGTTPERRSRLSKAFEGLRKNPGGKDLAFNNLFDTAMNTLNAKELVEHVQKNSKSGFGSAAVSKLRKGEMMVPQERIRSVFSFLAKHHPSNVITNGKRLMLLDILRNEEKLEALLGNRTEALFQEWVDSAFPVEQE